jgi:hypothetical protein
MLFMSMGQGYVSELRPADLLLIPQMIYEYREPHWSNIDMGNRIPRRKPCFRATLSTTNLSHGLTRARTWASAVRGWRLTA